MHLELREEGQDEGTSGTAERIPSPGTRAGRASGWHLKCKHRHLSMQGLESKQAIERESWENFKLKLGPDLRVGKRSPRNLLLRGIKMRQGKVPV